MSSLYSMTRAAILASDARVRPVAKPRVPLYSTTRRAIMETDRARKGGRKKGC